MHCIEVFPFSSNAQGYGHSVGIGGPCEKRCVRQQEPGIHLGSQHLFAQVHFGFLDYGREGWPRLLILWYNLYTTCQARSSWLCGRWTWTLLVLQPPKPRRNPQLLVPYRQSPRESASQRLQLRARPKRPPKVARERRLAWLLWMLVFDDYVSERLRAAYRFQSGFTTRGDPTRRVLQRSSLSVASTRSVKDDCSNNCKPHTICDDLA